MIKLPVKKGGKASFIAKILAVQVRELEKGLDTEAILAVDDMFHAFDAEARLCEDELQKSNLLGLLAIAMDEMCTVVVPAQG